MAEENTPWPQYEVKSYLSSSGLVVTDYEEMIEDDWDEVDQDSSSWIKLRSGYFMDAPTQRSRTLFWGVPIYLMIAQKPDGKTALSEANVPE